jgi:hypothetical protein
MLTSKELTMWSSSPGILILQSLSHLQAIVDDISDAFILDALPGAPSVPLLR